MNIIESLNFTESNPFVVSDYPYGFNLRCKMRCWIETAKRGDRFCRQTQNPKTENWNKPKKSVYSAVMVAFLDENNHVDYFTFSKEYSNFDEILSFLLKALPSLETEVKGLESEEACIFLAKHNATKEFFSSLQMRQIKQTIAIRYTGKFVKMVIDDKPDRTPEEQEEHDKEQDEIRGKLLNVCNNKIKTLL